ncbi:MAG: cytochrome-c oxidase, partial [Candidatus Schekmanbacteria bacterium RBG_13_48_7]
WLGLIICTGLTVVVAGLDLGGFSILTVLLIASFKCSMVLYIFMHLKYESNLIRLIFIIAVIALAIFIGLTFTDISFRQV